MKCGVRNLVAADVSPLHLIPREVGADSRRLLRPGSSVRSACVFLWLLLAATSHSLPSRKSSDDIPPLVPPLPEIPPSFWEQHGWVLWVIVPFVLLVVAGVGAFVWLRPRKPPVLPATAAQARAALTALLARLEDGATLVEISQTLRRFLITTFWLPSGETTTAEFCANLAKNEQVGAELAGAVAEFLRACDEQKFSPAPAGLPLDAARRALKLVEHAETRRAAARGPAQIEIASPASAA